jgi:hypothetical protein
MRPSTPAVLVALISVTRRTQGRCCGTGAQLRGLRAAQVPGLRCRDPPSRRHCFSRPGPTESQSGSSAGPFTARCQRWFRRHHVFPPQAHRARVASFEPALPYPAVCQEPLAEKVRFPVSAAFGPRHSLPGLPRPLEFASPRRLPAGIRRTPSGFMPACSRCDRVGMNPGGGGAAPSNPHARLGLRPRRQTVLPPLAFHRRK